MIARTHVVTLAVVVLAASGRVAGGQSAPVAGDTAALAPRLQGLGTHTMRVSSDNPDAQAFFDQGLRLLYAFNHAEARRAFQEAARLDPRLAMARWGEAMTLSVNINAPMTPEAGRLAYAAARDARALAGSASARERALVEALATRFAPDGAAPRPPLDRAYAEAMTSVAATFSTDVDVQTLYADAVMNTMAWDYWRKDGTLKPEAEPVRLALERAIAREPNHPGANHYYIHLMEGSSTPEAAEPSAERLGGLMPAAGHMVHMPAHIYLRVGRYADAAEANVRAIAADEDYLAQCQAQGLYPVSYYPHNLHFLWAAATMEGRRDVAISAARQVAAKVPHHHAGALAWTADFPVTPWLAYVRFGRWQEMLTEPAPPITEPYATGIWRYGRGLAFIARGDERRAEAEIEALESVQAHEAFRTVLKDSPLLTNLQIAARIVRGELASRRGNHGDAVRLLREATALEDGIPYNEPPVWHQAPRHVLGALLLAAGAAAEAEAEYRRDLQRFRRNGWSLFGLWQSLVAQQRTDEAQRVRAEFDQAWVRADVTLTSSRIMTSDLTARSARVGHPPGGLAEKFLALSTGVRMEYVEQGPADGLPVIFLHGVTDSWRSFERVLPLLPAHVRAFAISARGHGDSSRPDRGYLIADMSADLHAFTTALKIDKVILVGHSMGAMVAQRFAADHPDHVAALVLAGAFDTLFQDRVLADFYRTAIEPLADPIDAGFAREWQLSTVAGSMDAAHLDAVVAETLKVPARVWREAFGGFLATPDFTADLRRVAAPVLLVWGDKDAYVDRPRQDRLLAALPAAQLTVYKDGGHAMHWEDPARFASDLVTFLATVERAATHAGGRHPRQ